MTRWIGCALAGAFALFWSAQGLPQTDPEEQPQLSDAARVELEGLANTLPPDGSSPFDQCIHLHKKAVANIRLGQYETAIADLERAQQLSPMGSGTRDQWCERWRIQVDLERALRASGDEIGRIAQMLRTADEQRNANSRRHLLTLQKLVDAYIELGMLDEADKMQQQTQNLLPEVQHRRDWTEESDNILANQSAIAAQLLEARGKYSDAERYRRISLTHYLALARMYLRKYGDGHALRRSGLIMVGSATRRLANTLSAQGKTGEAEYHARSALAHDLGFASFTSDYVSSDLAAIAAVKLQRGQLAAAERWAALSLKSLEGGQIQTYAASLADRRWLLAFIDEARGRWADALALFAKRDTGLRGNPEQFARRGSDQIDWALALSRNGRHDEAKAMLDRLLARQDGAGSAGSIPRAQLEGYLGIVLASRGNISSAAEKFRTAVPELLRHSRGESAGEAGGFVDRLRHKQILEAYLATLASAVQSKIQLPVGDPAAEAFRIAEIARSSTVQRAINASAARARLPDVRLGELARLEQDTSNHLQALNKILARLASAPEGRRLPRVMADMQRDIGRLEIELSTQRNEMARLFPAYAELVDPQPIGIADVQRSLGPSEALLSLYVAPGQTYVWSLRKDRYTFYVVPAGHDQLAAIVKRIRATVDLADGELRPYDFGDAFALYQLLLAQSAASWADARVLNIVPHGPLGQIPFAMLPTEPVPTRNPTPGTAVPWLIQRIALAQQPSANSFVALRQAGVASEDRKPLIGFGDPVFAAGPENAGSVRSMRVRNLRGATINDMTLQELERTAGSLLASLPPKEARDLSLATEGSRTESAYSELFAQLAPLPDTSQELIDIAAATGANTKADIFLGPRATEGNVKTLDLQRFRVIAFATHGLMAGEVAELDQPALALANPRLTGDRDNDGLLTLDEVLALRINADWVVLSACNTASSSAGDLAEDIDGHEAVSGLGRGFFFAGARSLLVTNWAVETVSARLLTTGLFRHQKFNPSASRAQALREAMLAVMKADPEYSHPAFWAPFSLVGDGGR